ncbi:rhamnulose-1-phosphate aldolase [Serratia sp. AKBS12]|uniref:rhamnulose-1-phosphate aldolase n=1 Tax=Serratia sp. AKBS12 TaxID=2974597 RepID=UPI00216514F1|nr:rhamnulose-1-phosphate aldolase [Serratia sp. AKBS12]MCS3409143.1 rhamnulose-1-phosphate aldolase [Serratia sp. AKBS12]HEI8865469.1 rhamnulose-1-phosphate aldolase [Serratia odorifera]
MQRIISSWFVQGMIKATGDMWLKGWDERNGGNISLRLTDDDVAPYRADFVAEPRCEELSQPATELANCWFLVTGSGKFFRNVPLAPEESLVLLQVNHNGTAYHIHWGLSQGGLPTSELASHFQSHIVRMQLSGGQDRVIMHCHATNLIALSFVEKLESASFTRLLWEGSTECLVVFPDGIGIVPWMVPGTDGIGVKTAEQMHHHSLVLWPFHGIFATGPTLDEAFGLIDTAEKSAEIMVKVIAMGGKRQTISTEQFIALAARFGVTPMSAALEVQ